MAITGLNLPDARPSITNFLPRSRRCRVADDFEQHVAAHRQRFAEQIEQADDGWFGAQRAVLEDDAVIGHGGHQLGDGRAADGVEDDAGAVILGEFHHFGDEILLLGGDDVLGAELQQVRRACCFCG